jgi:hypothetical protein
VNGNFLVVQALLILCQSSRNAILVENEDLPDEKEWFTYSIGEFHGGH